MCLRVLLAVVCASLGLFAALVLAIALWLATARAGGAQNGPVVSRSGTSGLSRMREEITEIRYAWCP